MTTQLNYIPKEFSFFPTPHINYAPWMRDPLLPFSLSFHLNFRVPASLLFLDFYLFSSRTVNRIYCFKDSFVVSFDTRQYRLLTLFSFSKRFRPIHRLSLNFRPAALSSFFNLHLISPRFNPRMLFLLCTGPHVEVIDSFRPGAFLVITKFFLKPLLRSFPNARPPSFALCIIPKRLCLLLSSPQAA